MKDAMIALSYLLYVIVFDGGIIGGCAYLVFWHRAHGAWFILAIFLAACTMPPERWRSLFDTQVANAYLAKKSDE